MSLVEFLSVVLLAPFPPKALWFLLCDFAHRGDFWEPICCVTAELAVTGGSELLCSQLGKEDSIHLEEKRLY